MKLTVGAMRLLGDWSEYGEDLMGDDFIDLIGDGDIVNGLLGERELNDWFGGDWETDCEKEESGRIRFCGERDSANEMALDLPLPALLAGA